jgi:hypothetical protein
MEHFEYAPGVVEHCEYPLDHSSPHGILESARMTTVSNIGVSRPSVASLLLYLHRGGKRVGTATGFVVEHDNQRYLITNRHVVRGKENVPPPDLILVMQNRAGSIGNWLPAPETLYDDQGFPLWLEHPEHSEWDVVALPLKTTEGLAFYSHDPWEKAHMVVSVTDPLSIVGFPFGVTGGGCFGVYTRGFIATEPLIDWNNLPVFLIDSRTRAGQSGSPVIEFQPRGGVSHTAQGMSISSRTVEHFFGVYSGRLNTESDIGVVWKPKVIREIVEANIRAALSADLVLDVSALDTGEFGQFEEFARNILQGPKSAIDEVHKSHDQ